ncbi:MAG: hypothetical protein ACJA1N_002819, partial [Saprospiraceae bacterium]
YQFSIKKTLNLRHANQLHQHPEYSGRATNIDADIEKYKTQLATSNGNTIIS